MLTRNPRFRTDAGFTLIELLVAISLLGILTVPIADLTIQYFRTQTAATSQLGESHDVQITNAYWQQDIASMGVRASGFDQTAKTFTLQNSFGVAFGCSVPPGVSTPFAVIGWTSYDSTGI